MKIKTVFFVFFSAIVLLLGFQSLWLYISYRLMKANLGKKINAMIKESVEGEVKNRQKLIEFKDSISVVRGDVSMKEDTSFQGHKLYDINMQEALEAGLFQQVLHVLGYPFDMQVLDSIFQRTLQKDEFPNYSLCFRDSTGAILEETGNLSPSRIDKVFKSDALLIFEGKRVQAFVEIYPSTVFLEMSGLLIASFIVLMVLLFIVSYQYRSFYTLYMLSKYKIDFNDKLVHSLKTPISSVSIILSNLTKGIMEDKPETKQKYLNMASNEMTFMLTLTEKILTIAKFDEKKPVINRSLTDIRLIINELKDLFSLSNGKKQVTICTTYQIDAGIVLYLDGTLIKDAISALIENAIKYSDDCVTIVVDCYARDNTLYIRVKDNGFGIQEKDQKDIFKKFARGKAATKKEILGYGLGLSYVESIAHAHNGIVQVISDGKKGSEFTIVLPLNKNIYKPND